MKRLVLLLAMLFAVVPFGFARGHGHLSGHHHSSHASNHASRKSHAAAAVILITARPSETAGFGMSTSLKSS
jgi:hypothetical protein